MTVREILTLPDRTLKQPVDPVETLTEEIRSTLEDLSDTVDDSPGIALAAPQIGEPVPAICVDASQDKKRDESNHGKCLLVNPTLVERDNPEVIREGCLSVPDYTGDVSRYQTVTVEGLSPGGEKRQIEATGWEAVAFQHEIDHLHGTLFLDRIEHVHENLHRRKK